MWKFLTGKIKNIFFSNHNIQIENIKIILYYRLVGIRKMDILLARLVHVWIIVKKILKYFYFHSNNFFFLHFCKSTFQTLKQT